ncbi:MAG: YwiC-like family protein, partial [Holophaga sp.]|nr:YwiC-like family protein [Holophaga sp.]
MNPKPISMMPREHGAYAQLGVSLLASLFLVPASPRAWGQALATTLVFLASEPLLVLMGRRG